MVGIYGTYIIRHLTWCLFRSGWWHVAAFPVFWDVSGLNSYVCTWDVLKYYVYSKPRPTEPDKTILDQMHWYNGSLLSLGQE